VEQQKSQPSKEELTRRSRRSKGKGYSFEIQVINELKKMGYAGAKRVARSGAAHKKPYDVKVSPFRLKLEAKRRMGGSIPIEGKWLDRIAPKFAMVFAVGRRLGRGENDAIMYSISLANETHHFPEVRMSVSKTVHVRGNEFTIPRGKGLDDLVVKDKFIILYGEKKYLVQDFHEYMSVNWEVKKNELLDGKSV